MRATASISPARKGKQRLLGSCAIAAGLAALAIGGPALAQGVAGSGQVVSGTATISPPAVGAPPNTTNVTTTTAQTIINWTPTDTAATGTPIDFLPFGNTLNFYGTGQYIVLNRFVAINPITGLPIPISRQIALNGTVNSYNGTPFSTSGNTQGGNIWFYNAGGILIGARAAINVGSLVLTTNDIITTGGLLGPGGEIRFRGASGSTASIDISAQSFIDASYPGNPGSSYVALVAPRINQGGLISVDGSAALVAAEQADITINNGLFNINVLVGAEGGNVITHTGVTGGPAHQQGDTDQSRVYMVAIPKNDAVTMLVTGQVGYQDAVVAQTEPDGAVVLSAGYNIVNGALAAAPVNATAANITVNDTIFQSSVTARASGAFVGQPIATIPTGGPATSVPPPHIGRLIVQGNATFIGDASASLAVGTGQLVGATGNLTVTSGGVAGQPGSASVTSNGGQLVAVGNLTINGGGRTAADGSAQGGDAALSITGGAVLVGGNVLVNANGVAGIGVSGAGGTGTGGNASIDVSNPGGSLTAGSITANARGIGGGLIRNPVGIVTGAVGVGGNGQGGTATIAAQNGGSINVTAGLTANADGVGQTGTAQSGNGTGGTARIDILGESTVVGSPLTTVSAAGLGGGSFSGPLGTILSLAGGDGQGGSAILNIGADSAASVGLGAANVVADGTGGGAGGGENASGGNGTGGNATVLADNGVTANFATLAVTAIGQSGGAASPSGLTATSGDGVGGTVTVSAVNGSSLLSLDTIILDATGQSVVSNNIGSGTGGDIAVTASSGGLVSANGEFQLIAPGGSGSSTIGGSSGSGTGGDIDLTADGGTIRAGFYAGVATAGTTNSTGASGAAQGGTIDLLATNAGVITATNPDQSSAFDAGASTGISAGGASATGGTVNVIADGGTINFNGAAQFSAGGVSGGDGNFGTTAVPMGMGGTVLIQLANAGTMSFTDLFAGANGSSAVDVESVPGLSQSGSATGQGGNLTIDIQSGTFTANDVTANADGFGGNANGSGQGGTIAYTQTGGAVTVNTLSMTANALGGGNDSGTKAGTGTGGDATLNLLGGTLDVTNLSAEAMGMGGFGTTGFDAGPGGPAGDGGDGIGGTATINLNGTAVVTAQSVTAGAAGVGGLGGNFVSTMTVIGSSGDGGAGNGGTAIVNLTAGTLTTGSLSADAGGFGGNGGDLFNSSSSGTPTGASVGGDGGSGQGGTATIVFSTPVTATGTVGSYALGVGGVGGDNEMAGNGGDGTGGTAGLVVDDLALGTVGAIANAEALGGAGGDASFGLGGPGGSGGNAAGGTARLTVQGPNGSAGINPSALSADGTGGDAGSGSGLGATGDGGNGTGGTVELLALDGTLTLVPFSSGPMSIRSSGIGGTGTTDGDGTGGTINLIARGGAITSGGNPVSFLVDGSGDTTQGGTIRLSSENAPGGVGSIQLADTTMNANGDRAGRIEISTDTSIALTSLDAQATGTAAPTNNDTNVAPAGIFLAATGGTISTDGAMTLNTGSSVGVYAQGDGQVSVGGGLTVTANDQVDIRHDPRTGTAPTIQTSGALSITAANSISGAPGSLLSAGTSLSLNATNGTIGVDSLDAQDVILILAPNGNIAVAGTATSNDIVVNGGFGVNIANATANDDLSIIGNALTLGRLTTNGTGADSELDGSNIFLGSQGATTVVHAEADNDFTAQVGSFATGLNSIITGGDISVTAPGAINLGNSTAGGSVFAQGLTIAFNTVDAGSTVSLNANGGGLTDGINGVNIDAGGDINLIGRFVNVSGNTTSTGSLFAFATDSTANFGLADVDGNIAIVANTNLTGTYRSGGNINLNANNNLTAEANATGGYVTNSVTSEGYVYAVANNGTATLTNSSAATMMGVRAGTVGTITNATAGEDILLIAGSTANVTNAVAGDDLVVNATCCIVINNASTSGLGVDSRTLVFASASTSGPSIFQTQASPPNQSNVTLTVSAGTIDATDVVAFDNLTANATGVVTTTGTIRSGQATTITGSSLDLESVTAGTDIVLTSNSGGISAIGALSAGHDLTITSSAGGAFAGLSAGDDIRINAAGNVTAGTLLTTAGGADNEADNAGVYIDTPGSIAITGATNAVGQARFTAGGTIGTGAITADYSFIDAVGAVTVTGDITSGGMYVEGSSVAIRNALGNSGDIVLRATGGDLTANGSVTTQASVLAEATGAITITGDTLGGNFVQMTGGSIDVADVTSSSFVFLTSTSGTINSTGTVSAGSDVIINAATGGQFNALIAGDDVSINAGGNVTIASITAEGSNPQGEEIGSNVSGTVTGTLTVTGSTFAASDVTFNAASIALQDVEAGGSFTATSTGGPITLNSADVANNITLTSARDVVATGLLQSGQDTTATGRNLDLQAIAADGDVELNATVGNISTGGNVSGFNVTFDANGDIVHNNASLLSATNILTLTAGGNIDVGNATSGDNMRFTAGGMIDANALTAGRILVLDADGAVTLTGDAFGALLVSVTGSEVDLGDIAVGGGNIGLFATGGDISGTGPINANGGVTALATGAVDLTGNIVAASSADLRGASVNLGNVSANGFVSIAATNGAVTSTGLLSAGQDLFIATTQGATLNNLVAGDDIGITGGGAVTIASLRANGTNPQGEEIGSNAVIDITGTLTVTGDSFAADDATFNALSIALQGVEAGGSLTATSTGGPITLAGADAGANVVLTSARTVTATGPIQSGQATTIRGTALDLQSVAAGTNVSLTATGGAVSATGTIDAGRDIVIATTGGGSFDRLIAGDDIDLSGSGDIDVAFMDATGDSPDSGETGSNITINLAGNAVVDHAEAAGDFTADVTSFRTGLNSIITDGDIDITAVGAANLGNSTAGGSIGVAAQSIAFTTLDAGDFVNLNATGTAVGAEGIAGTTILAGGDVFLTGNSITVGNIDAGGRLSAFGSGGDVAIANAVSASNIGVLAGGNISGTYSAGGDIELSAGGNIAVTANAAGGAPDPSNGDVNTAGNVFVDAAGDVILSNSSAAGMYGVNADGSATLTNVTAGEDMLVLAGTTASLSGITVGDDLVVRAAGAVTATGASATGAGPDGFLLDYIANGFTIGQGEGVSSVDGADITLRSTGGSVTAAGLSAGDDIILNAATALSVSGATTRGIGQTGGDSSIRTQSGSGTFAGLNAFSDIAINASGAVAVTAPATAGRDIAIAAGSVDVASLTTPAGTSIDGLAAGRNLQVTASGAITGGAVRAGGNLALVAGTTIDIERAATAAGGSLALNGATGVTAGTVASGGATSLDSASGAIEIASLSSVGPVAASGDSILIGGGSGDLIFNMLNADVGDASVTNSGNLAVTAGTVAGRATLRSTNGDLSVTQLAAADAQLGSDDDMTLGNVTASNSLLGEAGGVLTVNGAVTAREMSFGSADIVIAANGRLGTAGTTLVLDVRNTDDNSQTFIGGTGTRGGYHIDAAEMARLYGTDISIFAPEVENNNGGFVAAAPGGLPIGSVGSSAQPDVIIDDFTMTAGGPTSNLGANGSLTIETPGKARVIGDVLFTGMGDNNGLAIRADDALEVILGEGTIRLVGASSSTGGTSTPGGLLTLVSDDVIVATASAIADVRDAADIAAIDDRLAMNDGVTSNDGALFAGGIEVDVINGFYVQNSGTGTRFAERRGLTFGPLGLNVNVEGADTRIVINGVHLGPSGQVTGLDTIPLLSINGFVIGSGPLSGSGLAFNSGSTMNGCLIVSSTTCAFLEFESSFPVQDVIDDDDDEGEGDDAEGMSLPVPLITMRNLDPLTGEPLLDDPVTGAGNDDLWTPPSE